MNFFKVPSPNELKLSADECNHILYKDSDPLIYYMPDSESEDEGLSLSCMKVIQQDSNQAETWQYPRSIGGKHIKTKIAWVEHVIPDVTVGSRNCNSNDQREEVHYAARIDDPVTLKWLEDNFECHVEYSIPRGDMFKMFTQYCSEHDVNVLCNQATFGKSVRAIFPSLKTRRIGIRGHSRYHYDGIRPKMTSYLCDRLVPRKKKNVKLQVNWKDHKSEINQDKYETEFGINYPADHLMTILIPGFPTMKTVKVDGDVREEISMFLMMYRCYTVDILKTVIKTRFTQLKNITSTFWKSLPTDVKNILEHTDTLKVIKICDSMMYNCVIKLLIPSVLVAIPTGLDQSSNLLFGKDLTMEETFDSYSVLQTWRGNANGMLELLEKTFGPSYITEHFSALISCPFVLQRQSGEEVVKFTKKLSERVKLCQLCGRARDALQCAETIKSMRSIIKRLDPKVIADIASFPVVSLDYDSLYDRIDNGIYEFQQLLAERAKFDKYVCWLKAMVIRSANSVHGKVVSQNIARNVVLELSYIIAIIAREINFDASNCVKRAYHHVEAFFISYVKFLLETEHLS